MKKLFLITLLFLSVKSVDAQDANLFKKESFNHKGFELPYRIMYPQNYNPKQKYPLLLFLHGAGERGSNNEAQLAHGSRMFIEYNRTKFPALVIIPQCPADNFWAVVKKTDNNGTIERVFDSKSQPTLPLDAVMALVKQELASGRIDKKRVYVAGLSMGGMGTFEILWRMPKTFAAAVPICGGGDVAMVKKYAKNTSLWIFHGAKDDVVLPEYSRSMYSALKSAGANVKYTEYPEANHNSWDAAFKEEQLMPWMFSR